MGKIKIITIGKTKEMWLNEAIQEYQKRIKYKIEFVIAKDENQLIEKVNQEKDVICLDSTGKLMNSEEFSDFIVGQGSKITFVIGGPDGLPKKLSENPISLSPLTFTHQMTRLILLEQIYRAFEIEKGSKYHK